MDQRHSLSQATIQVEHYSGDAARTLVLATSSTIWITGLTFFL